MQFEYEINPANPKIPHLIIPVSEFLKAKKFKTDEKANEQKNMINKCIAIYTAFCGDCKFIPSAGFLSIYNQIGKSGKVYISCEQTDYGQQFVCRLISNEGEKFIDLPL